MFNFTKKIAIVASLMALFCGQNVALGSAPQDDQADSRLAIARTVEPGEDDENAKKTVVVMNLIPKDVLKEIFKIASADTHPSDLQKVCVYWRDIMRQDAVPVTDLTYDTLNPFMKLCTDIWIASEGPRRFKNGILRYTPEDGGAIVELKFSDLANPFCGTFDLSKCGDKSQFVRITTSLEEFFIVNGENRDRLVFLTCPFHVVEQAIQSNPDHPFSKILPDWDKSKSPMGMFWRWGLWRDQDGFEYLLSDACLKLSAKNLYENLKKSKLAPGMHFLSSCCEWNWCGDLEDFMLVFGKPKLSIKEKNPSKKPRLNTNSKTFTCRQS